MNRVKRIVNQLERKYKARIKRAKIVANLMPGVDQDGIDRMVADQLEDIRSWPRDAVLREFCDPEELLLRGILKRYSE